MKEKLICAAIVTKELALAVAACWYEMMRRVFNGEEKRP